MARNKDIGAQLRNQFKTDKNSKKEIKPLNTDKTLSSIDNSIPESISNRTDEDKYITIRKGGRPTIGTENRSKKITVLLTPSLYEAVKETAYQKRISINELIFNLLEKNVIK